MNSWRTAAPICVVLLMLLVGCGGSSDEADPGTTLTPSESSTSDPTGEPSVEPTDPESTQATRDKPSIQIASAPIGGNVQTDGADQCAEVNWLGRNPIPAGTTIQLGEASLDPTDLFDLYQDACDTDLRPCTEVTWQTTSFTPCYVGARQVARGDRAAKLIIAVTATCETQADCQSLAGETPGSQISFAPGDLVSNG
jgi:hypothetical protein